MKKNVKTLMILAGVLVVCIGAYVGVRLYNGDVAEKEAAESADIVIYPADYDTPAAISYEADGETLSFTLEDSTWYYDGNLEFPLKQSKLTSLSSTLQSLTAVRSFEAVEDLSAYGLDTPTYTVTSTDGAGNTLTLLIGSMNGENYYAMVSGASEMYTIEDTLAGYLEPDILEMITLDTIPTLSESTIDRITLTDGVGALTLDKYQERDESYTWYIVEDTVYTSSEDFVLPDGSTSAEVYVTDLLSALQGLSFSSCAVFDPAETELEAYGLSEPSLTVTVDYTTADDSETSDTVVLEIGQILSDESGYYARLSDSTQINVLSADDAAALLDALSAMVSAS